MHGCALVNIIINVCGDPSCDTEKWFNQSSSSKDFLLFSLMPSSQYDMSFLLYFLFSLLCS